MTFTSKISFPSRLTHWSKAHRLSDDRYNDKEYLINQNSDQCLPTDNKSAIDVPSTENKPHRHYNTKKPVPIKRHPQIIHQLQPRSSFEAHISSSSCPCTPFTPSPPNQLSQASPRISNSLTLPHFTFEEHRGIDLFSAIVSVEPSQGLSSSSSPDPYAETPLEVGALEVETLDFILSSPSHFQLQALRPAQSAAAQPPLLPLLLRSLPSKIDPQTYACLVNDSSSSSSSSSLPSSFPVQPVNTPCFPCNPYPYYQRHAEHEHEHEEEGNGMEEGYDDFLPLLLPSTLRFPGRDELAEGLEGLEGRILMAGLRSRARREDSSAEEEEDEDGDEDGDEDEEGREAMGVEEEGEGEEKEEGEEGEMGTARVLTMVKGKAREVWVRACARA